MDPTAPTSHPLTTEPDAPAPAIDATPRVPRRALAIHALALLAVLVASALLVGSHGRFSADEGAATITSRSLADGHGWLTPHPLPEVDRVGSEYPLVASSWGTKGTSAYAKHAAYPALASVAERVVPGKGLLVLSILGTVGAAVLAAFLAARIAPGCELPTLWVVGVASPLFVDSQILMAHTLAAATATAAVLAALRATDGVGRVRLAATVGWLASMAAALVLTILLRTEGLFLALGLAGAFTVRAVGRDRVRSGLAAAMAIGSAGFALLLDRVVLRAIVGAPVTDPSTAIPLGSGSYLAQRVHSFVLTVLRPSYGGGIGALLLFLAYGLLALGLFALLRPDPDVRAAAALTVAGAAVALVRAVGFPVDGVPGLAGAYPVAWIGLAAAWRHRWNSDERQIVLIATTVFGLGVVATQYGVGGGQEWGGRYFALAVPLVAPFAVSGLSDAAVRFDHATRRVALAGLAGVVLALSILGLRVVGGTSRNADVFYRHLPVATAGLGDRPVVVTSYVLLPRLAGRDFDRERWLLADRRHPRRLVDRLRGAGIRRFVLVTADPVLDARLVAGARKVSTSTAIGWQFVIYET